MGTIVDVDSHVYEPTAVWDQYIPAEYRGLAKSAFFHEIDRHGNRVTVVNGQPAKELNRRQLIRQAIWRPGMTPEQIGELDPDRFVAINPGAYDATARVADMDAMGVDQSVVFPTLFAEYLPQVIDPTAASVLASAYNDWIWDFAAQTNGRVHPVAILPMQSLLHARRELDRVAQKGFRSVTVRPAFYHLDIDPMTLFNGELTAGQRVLQGGGNSGARTPVFVEDRPYRPLWEQIDHYSMVACIHPSVGSTSADYLSSGGFAERVASRIGVAHTVAEPIAHMQDVDLFMTAAFFHGLLEDLPGLKLALLHAGVSWVPLALEKNETYLWLTAYGMAAGAVCLEPEEVWERQQIVVGFDGWDRPVGRMPDLLGEKAAWGSRYPNHDAAGPDEAVAMLQSGGCDEATVKRLMGGNAADLFGLNIGAGV
ncbi:MAG: amidohydrolase family protein [Acidimicrobiia bacterium]